MMIRLPLEPDQAEGLLVLLTALSQDHSLWLRRLVEAEPGDPEFDDVDIDYITDVEEARDLADDVALLLAEELGSWYEAHEGHEHC